MRRKRDRIASPKEATALITALTEEDRALWATVLYGGLRRGELMALRWEDVDLAAGVICVERSWDAKQGEIAPKSAVGRRTVPIASVLRGHLVEQRIRTHDPDGRVFGVSSPAVLADAGARAGLKSVGGGAARADHLPRGPAHLRLADDRRGRQGQGTQHLLGHANITITLDRYGHLMAGNEAEAVGLLDAYLAQASGGADA